MFVSSIFNASESVCHECRGRCAFFEGHLTCLSCGLEQGIPLYQDEWNVHERTHVYMNENKTDVCHTNYTNHTRHLGNHPVCFDKIEGLSGMPEEVMQTAYEIFGDYFAASGSIKLRGEERFLEFCTACVFYASKTMRQGGFATQAQIVQRVFREAPYTSIQWACKEIMDKLRDKPYLKSVINPIRTSDQALRERTDILSRMVRQGQEHYIRSENKKDNKEKEKEKEERRNNVQGLYKLAHKLFDVLCGARRDWVLMAHPEKSMAALVFVAMKLHKTPIKLHDAALLYGTSETLLLKTEKQILEVLKKKN